MKHDYSFDWSELAFASKKPIKELRATFIAAPRELSEARLNQLVKAYLPSSHLVFGIAKEDFVLGFEEQPQFRMQKAASIEAIAKKVWSSASKHKVYLLHYFQRELPYILEKANFERVTLVNGSWKHTFHTNEAYYILANHHIPYDMVSPFASEEEAKNYDMKLTPQITKHVWPKPPSGSYSQKEMLDLANQVAQFSYDYNYQTGLVLGKRIGQKDRYRFLDFAFNKVMPYQTFAMHHGASRERNFSPPHDLNHYDTVHAEVSIIIKAAEKKINLRGTTIFINLLPCPPCSRMFAETDIAELVYSAGRYR